MLKGLTHVEGVLFIGPAEGSLLGRLGMRSIGEPQSFAFSRHAEVAPEPVFAPIPPPVPQRSAAPIPTKPRPFSAFAAPVVPIKPAPEHSDAADLLGQIATLANEGKSLAARAACERYLQNHPPAAQVFYWLGVLSDVAGSALEAE
ncbi:hypothetical protein, partial [Colwellia sp. TT2012]|uniref:hypothetical protein n=1 Tax=Colwellia sp. TT2012 TaxID=1720342 RepID=UPI000A8E68A7